MEDDHVQVKFGCKEVYRLQKLTPSSAFNHYMALNGLLCADVPLRTYTLTHTHSDRASLLTSQKWG